MSTIKHITPTSDGLAFTWTLTAQPNEHFSGFGILNGKERAYEAVVDPASSEVSPTPKTPSTNPSLSTMSPVSRSPTPLRLTQVPEVITMPQHTLRMSRGSDTSVKSSNETSPSLLEGRKILPLPRCRASPSPSRPDSNPKGKPENSQSDPFEYEGRASAPLPRCTSPSPSQNGTISGNDTEYLAFHPRHRATLSDELGDKDSSEDARILPVSVSGPEDTPATPPEASAPSPKDITISVEVVEDEQPRLLEKHDVATQTDDHIDGAHFAEHAVYRSRVIRTRHNTADRRIFWDEGSPEVTVAKVLIAAATGVVAAVYARRLFA